MTEERGDDCLTDRERGDLQAAGDAADRVEAAARAAPASDLAGHAMHAAFMLRQVVAWVRDDAIALAVYRERLEEAGLPSDPP